jgi:hypothetical protein
MKGTLWRYLNAFNSDYHETERLNAKKKNDDYYDYENADENFLSEIEWTTSSMTRRINQLTESLMEQITIYSVLMKTGKIDQIDLSTSETMRNFSMEAELLYSLYNAFANNKYDEMYRAFEVRNEIDKKNTRTLLNKYSKVFLTVVQKLDHLNKRAGSKVRFGNSMMIYLVVFISLLSFCSADQCCSFSSSNCPFTTNPVTYELMNYNSAVCESYTSRYLRDNSSSIYVTECTSNVVDPVSCLGTCQSGCNGNLAFCSDKTCDGNKCFCEKFPVKYIYTCLNEDGDELGECYLQNYTCYSNMVNDFKKRVVYSCPQIDVLSDKDFIYTTINTDYTGCVLYVNKDTWSYQSSYNDPNLIVKIDETAKIRSGRFEVRVVCSSNPCHHSSVYANYDVNCVLIDCVFCWEVFSSVNCLPLTYKVFVFFVILLTFSLVIASLPCFWLIIYTSWKCLMVPKSFCWPFMMSKYKNMNKKISKTIKEIKRKEEVNKVNTNSKRVSKNPQIITPNDREYNNSEEESEMVEISLDEENMERLEEKEKMRLQNLSEEWKNKPVSRGRQNLTENNNNANVNTIREEIRTGRRRSGNSGRLRPNLLAIVFCVCLFGMSNGVDSITCSNNPPISVSSPSCVSSSASAESCTFTFSTTITIPYPGASACLKFNDNNNKLLGTMNITYVNRTDTASLTTSYYTGRWKPLSSSFHGCYQNGWCDAGCSSATARNMYGFSSLIAAWPGFTYCSRRCGCAGCGCFFCDAGCVVSGYSLQYQDSAMAVAEVNKLSYSYYLKYDYASTSNTWAQSSASNTIGPFKIDYIGAFSGNTQTMFGTKNVIFNSTSTYWGEAATLNSPTQQNVGDIQSASLTQLQSSNPNSFIYDPNIISSVDQDKSVNFYFTNPGMNNINQYPKFPTTIGGQVWSYSSGMIRSVASSPGQVVLTITTTSPITLTRTKTTVCPIGEFMSGSGCRNCDIGSTIVINAKSSCSPGRVVLSVDDTSISLNTQTIDLKSVYEDFEIDLYTSKQVNNFNLLLSSDGNTYSIPISFAAVENITVREDNSTLNGNSGSGSSSSSLNFMIPNWDSFIKSLTDPSSAFYYASIIIVVIVTIVVVVIFALIMSWIVKTCTGSGKRY